MEWEPIDTAPDNEIVLICDEDEVNPAMRILGVWYFWDGETFSKDQGRAASLNHYVNGYKPDYWMPLPKAWEPFDD